LRQCNPNLGCTKTGNRRPGRASKLAKGVAKAIFAPATNRIAAMSQLGSFLARRAIAGLTAAFVAGSAFAATANLDNVRLGNDVVPAPFGYEPAPARYTVSEETQVYVSPYIYPGTVDKTKLKPGAAVDVLAKAKGYDWILVGKNGVGVGYIPLARLTPAR